MARQYTGRERVMAACKGEPADRVPINVVVPRAHELVGFTAQECALDPEKALTAQIKAHEMFPSDMMRVPGDPFLPTTANATYEARFGPGTKQERWLEDKSALAELRIRALRDPKQSRRFATYLEMCHKANSIFKDVWVSALLGAPWSIAANLRGAEALVYDTRDDPQFVHELMRFATELTKMRGEVIIETGVALFLGETWASCSVISPRIYVDFVHTYLKDVTDHFTHQGASIDLHICGYTDPILEYTSSLDVDIIDIDAPTSLKKMVEVSQKRVAIKGNLASELFGEGTKEQIEESVRNCIEIAAQGGAYILSPGCSIPDGAPLENIRYFWEAAQRYGRYD
jgi:uroporphyrinogen decarboxylase